VIIEASALSEEQKIAACRLAAEGMADYVKTSTGLHPAGGATVADVALMKRACSLKIKAAGGIRRASTALALIEAGADRLGCSASVQIINELAVSS
jgi:deoxyribose-phosphate aldolase